MAFDSILVLAAVLALAGVVFVLLICSSWSQQSEGSCPARFWSRRPSWEHRHDHDDLAQRDASS